MKNLLLFSILIAYGTSAQTVDTLYKDTPKKLGSFNTSFNGGYSTAGSIHDSKRQKQLIIKDNVVLTTYNLQLTLIETEISDLEALECKALLERDTAKLKNIWLRDFTLDEPQNELHVGRNPIPYYVSYNRTIERLNVMDNIVYTSGYEHVQRLTTSGKVSDPVKQNYLHWWVKKFGVWKLSTKTHD